MREAALEASKKKAEAFGTQRTVAAETLSQKTNEKEASEAKKATQEENREGPDHSSGTLATWEQTSSLLLDPTPPLP